MKYIVHDWDEKFDGVLYFIQRLEEMLFHYSDDIVKAPIHNTATLILEYIELEKNQGVQAFHLDMVANELRESLSNDPIVKDKIGVNKVQKIVESLKNQQKSTVKTDGAFLDRLTADQESFNVLESLLIHAAF